MDDIDDASITTRGSIATRGSINTICESVDSLIDEFGIDVAPRMRRASPVKRRARAAARAARPPPPPPADAYDDDAPPPRDYLRDIVAASSRRRRAATATALPTSVGAPLDGAASSSLRFPLASPPREGTSRWWSTCLG